MRYAVWNMVQFVGFLALSAAATAQQVVPAATFAPASNAQPTGTAARGPSLSVGDQAPALSVATWVKGAPVKEFEKGKVYVVEFWATWCGPCRKSIPHLSDLQVKYKDGSVTVIGVSSHERNGLSDVTQFVEKQGDKMGYTVAWDQENKSSAAWMDASGQQGIPAAFIVNQNGRIAWIGHPNGIDGPLERVVKGQMDLEKEVEQARRVRDLQVRAAPIIARVKTAVTASDWPTVIAGMDEIIALDPVVMGEWLFYKFSMLAIEVKDTTKAYALARDAVAGPLNNNAQVLNAIAWFILDEPTLEKRDVALAKAAATRAVEISAGRDPAIIDTLARAHFDSGETAKAIELQTKALELSSEGQLRDEIKARLEQYRKSADGAAKTENK